MPIYKSVNKNFFKRWTREMAYVLGFFSADGYITLNRRGAHFWCIQITDKKLIEKIKMIIGSEHKISVFRSSKSSIKTSYRLQIGSIEMCNDLRNLGFTEKKTKSISVPLVPEKYLPDFVRGYFDGDGHVWYGYVNKGRKNYSLTVQTVFTSSSLVFLEKLKDKLEDVGILKGVIRKGKGDYYRLTYSVNGSLNLYKFMYNTHIQRQLFLERKKRVFEKYMSLRL